MSADKKYLKRLSDHDVIPSTDYLIEPYLPMGALVFVCGLPKVFKSFLSGIDWGYSIATPGCQWLGRPTRNGRVAYFALEAYTGVLRRGEAWRVFHEKPKAAGDNLAYITDRISFAEKTCSVDQHFTALFNAGFRPDLVIIDTWFKATAGGDVSGQPDMAVALKNLRSFQSRLTEWKVEDGLPEVTFVVIAHTDKKGQALFGSITQFADCDVLYQLDRVEHANQATLTCIDARDIEAPPAITFEMEKVPIVTAKGKEFNLVVSKEVAAAKEKTKQDQDLEDMEFQLEGILGNQATSAAWFDQMVKWTNGKQEGWSRKTFDRKLKKLKDTGRVTGGGNQGDLYSVLHTPEAERARHGGTTEEANYGDTTEKTSASSAKLRSVQPPSTVTLKGSDGGDDGFEDRKPPSNHRHFDGDGGSRSNCKNGDTTESPAVVPSDEESDLIVDALKQIKKSA
jgi:hypothetical protein